MTGLDSGTFTVEGLSAAFASGDLSPVDAATACLDHIERRDAELNAFVLVDRDRALADARASEARWRTGTPYGPLDGVPTSIKDLVLVRGWPTRKGSVHTDPEDLATDDAPVTRLLLAAGAVIVGKTSTPEYGWKGLGDSPQHGVTRNPWDPSRTSGGSSAGAAVAAATGMAVLNVGTDGGGSIRMPGGFCGVFGLKPTFALVPMYPPGVSGMLSHLGPLARTVRDAAHLMSVLAVPDSRDIYPTMRDDRGWTTDLDSGVVGLRIAYAPNFPRSAVDPQIAAAVATTAGLLGAAGAFVDEIGLDQLGLPDCRDAFLTLWDAALGRTVAGLPPEQLALSDPGLVATMRRGLSISAQEYLDADDVRALATLSVNRILDSYDVIISPQLPIVAFPVGSDVADPSTQSHWVDWTPFTYPINMTRHPAATVPIGLSTDGLPMAMQVVGRHFEDRLVLRVAQAVESMQPFAHLYG